jgi:hypothetical protein
VASEN